MITFSSKKQDSKLAREIATRAVRMAQDAQIEYEFQDAWMDIEAAHCNGCPLNLPKLLAADDGTFGHDVFGIRRFLDRETGKLTDCFVPRCALPEKAVINH